MKQWQKEKNINTHTHINKTSLYLTFIKELNLSFYLVAYRKCGQPAV